jgi:hypothetical protein
MEGLDKYLTDEPNTRTPKQKAIKLLVLKGSDELKGKTLHLVKTGQGIYSCKKHNIQIIDTDGDIETMQKKGHKEYYRLHLFSDSFDALKWIDDAKYIS